MLSKRVGKMILNLIACCCFVLAAFGVATAQGNEEKTEAISRKPPEIHGSGIIDRVDKDVIVINDRQFPLSQNYTKRSSADGSISSLSLKKGMDVGYELNKKNEIVTVWIFVSK